MPDEKALVKPLETAQQWQMATPAEKVADYDRIFRRMEKELVVILPAFMRPDVLYHAILGSFKKNPAIIARCTKQSIIRSTIFLGQIGLLPDTPFNHAHLVPFKDDCQVIVNYQGFAELGFRSGMVGAINSYIVYAEDDFHLEYGTNANIRHTPNLNRTSEEWIGAYGRWEILQGGHVFIKTHYMLRKEIEAIRDASIGKMKNPSMSPWKKFPESMIMKTPLRAGWKMLPKSPELALALEVDNRADVGSQADVPVPQLPGCETEPEKSKSDSLADELNGEGQEPKFIDEVENPGA